MMERLPSMKKLSLKSRDSALVPEKNFMEYKCHKVYGIVSWFMNHPLSSKQRMGRMGSEG